MNELIKNELEKNLGRIVLVFLKDSGFRFEGKILNVDEEFLKIYDIKSESERFIALDSIGNLEVKNDWERWRWLKRVERTRKNT